MAYQNISAILTQADIEAIADAIEVIQSKMPFAVVLEEYEKQRLVKLGNSLEFVEDANRAVKGFPAIVPASLNVPEFDKDTNLFRALSNIKMMTDSLARRVEDTHMAVGSEAMTTSLDVYGLVSAQRSRVPGLQAVWEKMRARFAGQGVRKKKAE